MKSSTRAFRKAFGLVLALVATTLASATLLAGPRKSKLPPDLTEILSRMNDAAKRLKTVFAKLEYTKVTVLVNDKSTESGQLFFRKSKNPEILIEIKKPELKTILFRKNQAEIYLPKINQIQEYDLAERSDLVQQFFLLGFGTESSELKKTYEVKYLSEEDLDGDTTALLELTPRSEATREQLTQIHLWISEESWIPVQQKFFQPGGDYFLARYTAVKVNRQIPSSTFRIKADKDAKRVKMN